MTAKTAIFLTATLAACFAASPSAFASVNISSAPTKNVVCSAGACAPTAKGAILNVTDLQNLLASSDVTVNTGSGAVTIEITAPLAWSSAHHLTLNADFNVSIKAAVAVEGTAALTVNYNNGGLGGQFQFFPGGKIDFWDTASSLSVNGQSYVLVNDLATMAGSAASSPSAAIAFAKDYDAAPDGTYQNAVAASGFGGVLEGLGHTVSNLAIQGSSNASVGMFDRPLGAAVFRDLSLANVNIAANRGVAGAFMGQGGGAAFFGVSSSGSIGGAIDNGGIAGQMSGGSIANSHSSVTIGGNPRVAVIDGGLVAEGVATIANSSFTGHITSGAQSTVGGLTGILQGRIVQSFSTGSIDTHGSVGIGGLAGAVTNEGAITDSYSMGEVTAHHYSTEGGMIGAGSGSVSTSYSTTQVNFSQQARQKSRVGGFAGHYLGGTLASDYWDIDTSLQSEPCANPCHAVTGLSDAALKAGLPSGFDPAIWAQSPSINAGYPYLIANPPQ